MSAEHLKKRLFSPNAILSDTDSIDTAFHAARRLLLRCNAKRACLSTSMVAVVPSCRYIFYFPLNFPFSSLFPTFLLYSGGIELDGPTGKHNGLTYFKCADGHGTLVDKDKVTMVEVESM